MGFKITNRVCVIAGGGKHARALTWNRLQRPGWTARDLDARLAVIEETSFLRVRHAASRESGSLERTFDDHSSDVNGCAVTPDVRRLISASNDRTRKIGDLADAQSAEPSTGRTGRELLVVDDPTPEGVPELVTEIARSGVNVLVQGETGVGKEVFAHTIHQLSGRPGPLLSINCAALSDALLESELFGYERGAFTGAVGAKQGLLEAAERGTLFLDEIGELPQAIQARLLRTVESREIRRLGSTKSIAIDVRILAASNRDLAGEVAAGRFRDDLLFRLDGVTLRIPPLRERRNAIAPLALKFIDEAARRFGRSDVRATPELFAALTMHDWPGNVRELKAVIDRAVLLARGAQLGSRHLAFTPTARKAAEPAGALAAQTAPVLQAAEQGERDAMIAALESCAGNQTRAAKALGIARSTLVAKMRLYRIPRPRT